MRDAAHRTLIIIRQQRYETSNLVFGVLSGLRKCSPDTAAEGAVRRYRLMIRQRNAISLKRVIADK